MKWGNIFEVCVLLRENTEAFVISKNKYKNKLYGERMPPCFITCIFLLEVFTIRY